MKNGSPPHSLGSRRVRAILPVLAVLSALVLGGACVSKRPSPCTAQSGCDAGWLCTAEGFCEQECADSKDCPCGSTCATSCGVCLRNDRTGPATCFAFRRGMGTTEVLGACRSDASINDGDGNTTTSEGGVCDLPEVSAPVCRESPPLEDATLPTDGDAGDPGREEVGGDDDGGPEAGGDQ